MSGLCELRSLFGKTAMAMVLHKSNNRPNRYGGTNYRTLCNRSNNGCSDGLNVADTDEEVTCKFCLKMMEK